MANEPQILNHLMFSLDGQILSTGFNSFEVKIGRESLDLANLETIGHRTAKGDWLTSVSLKEGYGSEVEAKLMAQFADESEESSLFLPIRSDTRNSPMDIPGNPAVFFKCKLYGVPHDFSPGKVKRLGADMNPCDGRQPNIGVVAFTSRAAIPDPLTELDSPVTSTPLEIGELIEGFELTGTVQCHSIVGDDNVTVLVEVLSDVDDTFATPTVQYTLPLLFTNEDPAPVGSILEPRAQDFVLDGDTDPVPGELAWALRITIVDDDAGGSGQVEISAALNLLAK